MRKKYLKLTNEQKKRGVIFSSQLMPDNEPIIHEVFEDDRNNNKIDLLLDDKFFNNSHWSYNLIRR